MFVLNVNNANVLMTLKAMVFNSGVAHFLNLKLIYKVPVIITRDDTKLFYNEGRVPCIKEG